MSEFRLRVAGAALLCLVTVGCSNVPKIVTEYKIDIQQGNVLSQDMVSQLKPGQTRDQVRYLLGTPMLTDVFHQQRWDYVYRLQKGATDEVETRKLSVHFDDRGLLEKVTGDVNAAQQTELVAPESKARLVDLGTLPEGEAGNMPPPEGPGYFRRLFDMFGM